MDYKLLEEIGLSKSEIKTYLALLKLGPSKTGQIIKESSTANSKIYLVLDKLIKKGLVTHFSKDGTKHYKAISPRMIVDYLEEKKRKIELQQNNVMKLLPSLLKVEESKEEEKEAYVFSGAKGVKTAFKEIVDELNKGEEIHIMGVYSFSSKFKPYALFFQKIRSQKGIKAKFLINNDAVEIAKLFSRYKPVEIRLMPKELFTPAIFLIYNDKVVINLGDELTFFVIKSKSARAAFDSYFKLLWKSSSRGNRLKTLIA